MKSQTLFERLELPEELRGRIRAFERVFDYAQVQEELDMLRTPGAWEQGLSRLKNRLGPGRRKDPCLYAPLLPENLGGI